MDVVHRLHPTERGKQLNAREELAHHSHNRTHPVTGAEHFRSLVELQRRKLPREGSVQVQVATYVENVSTSSFSFVSVEAVWMVGLNNSILQEAKSPIYRLTAKELIYNHFHPVSSIRLTYEKARKLSKRIITGSKTSSANLMFHACS